MDYKKIFYDEVNKIVDGSILGFVNTALNHADFRFWKSPCSSSGKFHPAEDNGEYGLLRHLIKASAVAGDFARRENFSEYELDIARAATLLHDICKDGNPWSNFTDYRHGIIGAEFLESFSLEDRNAKRLIQDAVRYHMTPWNTTFSPEKRLLFYSKDSDLKQKHIFSVNEVEAEIEEKRRGLMPHSIIEKCVQEADY